MINLDKYFTNEAINIVAVKKTKTLMGKGNLKLRIMSTIET